MAPWLAPGTLVPPGFMPYCPLGKGTMLKEMQSVTFILVRLTLPSPSPSPLILRLEPSLCRVLQSELELKRGAYPLQSPKQEDEVVINRQTFTTVDLRLSYI